MADAAGDHHGNPRDADEHQPRRNVRAPVAPYEGGDELQEWHLCGEADLESRAAAGRVGERERAGVRERVLVVNRKTEPRAAARRVVATIEPLDHAAALGLRDATPGV